MKLKQIPEPTNGNGFKKMKVRCSGIPAERFTRCKNDGEVRRLLNLRTGQGGNHGVSGFVQLRNAFLDAFQVIGGMQRLADFSQESSANERTFYQLISRMLPQNINLKDERPGNLIIVSNVPRVSGAKAKNKALPRPTQYEVQPGEVSEAVFTEVQRRKEKESEDIDKALGLQ